MVGIEAHLEKMQSLLHFDDEDGAMIVGISGPAGIGKTTIARALHSRLSSSFHLTCFMENVSGSYNRGLDDHGLKLSLQEQLLSKILNQNGMKIYHLGAIPERLWDQKVLIILDDVDDLEQLEALANEASWFGPGSKIIVTTEYQDLLKQHGINNTYHVDFPTKKDARKILCRYAFRQSLAPDGFEKLVERATELCSNLPLGLRVIGSTLRRKNKDDWGAILRRLENSIDRDIEGVLRVGYDNLHKDDQFLFLLIAFFFSYQDEDHVMAMLSESNLDVRFGLNTLADRSLIQKSTEGKIVMHKLLQQAGREAVQRQDQGKRQILIDTDEICDVLENDSGSRSVRGIHFDISTISNGVDISAGALKKLRNLQFLSIYKTRRDINVRVHITEDMDFPPCLRLLHWEVYPGKCLPPTFRPHYLVELNLKNTKLEKLWEGIQPLTNLKRMSLAESENLKELPDLSNATNLERLHLDRCVSLVEIPSSIRNLQKLKRLEVAYCLLLQVVPTHFNLACLEGVNMFGCFQLRKIPYISRNIISLSTTDTMIQDLPKSVRLWSSLKNLKICGSGNMENIPVEAASYLRGPQDIEEIPDCIKDLHRLEELHILGCPKLASLPELPGSLRTLGVYDCKSLETLKSSPFQSPIKAYFANCLKLGKEACRVITQQCNYAWLPGKNVPAEFNHRAIGNSMTIPSGTNEFRICVVLSPKQKMKECSALLFRQDDLPTENIFEAIPKLETEHLFICQVELPDKLESELLLEFSTTSKDINVIACGFQSFRDKTNRRHRWKERSLWHHDMSW
ncbi:unnamed protein product [Arabis nemorensis]|uniref:AAA+ ATPase domain-containing protein n=1 Tax=Arabis nemorensis TaxID=586526 RepID=A0A565C550_9BRAS|nr:unnamed protein product [Arabis nemorensis]